MDLLASMKARCSIRAYEDRPVDAQAARSILEAGRVAPTAANRQPVRVVRVASPEGLEALARGANVYGAPLAFVVCADRSRAWKRPCDGKFTADIDASIVCDHMMLQANALGLGSVWVCWFDPQVVAQALDLPERLEPVNILAVGHAACPPADPQRHATERVSIEEFALSR